MVWSFLLLAGCAPFTPEKADNNHLTIPDMIHFFEKSGVRIEAVSLVRRDIAAADDAVAIRIDGREIGIYKYNTRVKRQREKLDYVKEHGYIYLSGIKKTALLNGSFVLVGSDSNRQQKIIEKVFQDFR